MHAVLSYFLNALDDNARAKLERMRLGQIMTGVSTRNDDVLSLMNRMPDRARRSIATNVYFAGEKTKEADPTARKD